MQLLELLPFDVMAVIWCEWLTVKSLSKFDSANFCTRSRQLFLSCLSDDVITVEPEPSFRAKTFLSWICLRALRVRRLFLLENHFDGEGKFLLNRLNLKQVTSIKVDKDCRISDDEMVHLINACPKLSEFPCLGLRDSVTFNIVSRIDVNILKRLSSLHFGWIRSPCEVQVNEKNVSRIVAHCFQLRAVTFAEFFDLSAACALVRNNPKLKFIDCQMFEGGMSVLVTALQYCPEVEFVSVFVPKYACDGDELLGSVVNHLQKNKHLNYLCVADYHSTHFLYKSTEYTREHNRHGCQTVATDDSMNGGCLVISNPTVSTASLIRLLSHVKDLVSVTLDCDAVSDEALVLVGNNNSELASLVLRGQFSFTGADHLFRKCADLRDLVLIGCDKLSTIDLSHLFLEGSHCSLDCLKLVSVGAVTTQLLIQILHRHSKMKLLTVQDCDIESDLVKRYAKSVGRQNSVVVH